MTARALHPCENRTANMEPGGPLELTPCDRPARRWAVGDKVWWLCDEHGQAFKGSVVA